jgi:hypothetical protein
MEAVDVFEISAESVKVFSESKLGMNQRFQLW